MIDQTAYAEIVRTAIERVLTEERHTIARAGEMIFDALRRGGVLQTFGTGHSREIALELVGRAGGLVPANQLGIRDLVYYGDASPQDILDPKIERVPGLAERIWNLADIRPQDVFVVISNSGGNAAIVEMARLAVDRGHQVVGITSLAHTSRVPGERLIDLAHVVIDNGAPYGDAVVELPSGVGAVGAISSVTGALIAQLLVTEVVGHYARAGEDAPVFISANTPVGDDHNDRLMLAYGSRVRLGDA
ncbi:SIS domain-containing protein [Rhizohabitans arisaemae]|uniref:SIS domain-containing protein n=1 Tax=Rhizohabitans arisaemae TaxID=2720610 RepID=UPI0024B0B59E|nr:SIS domain-containing protein [Rhizohabitans arisaemae]